MKVLTERQIVNVKGWEVKLAELVRHCWTSNCRCYFPYQPLTTPEFWGDVVAKEWKENKMFSWACWDGEKFNAHFALVEKHTAFGNYWELGRVVSRTENPKFTVMHLHKVAMDFGRSVGFTKILAEATQAHTASQHICLRNGMRFAGLGILQKTEDGIYWDILYFDTADDYPFFSGRAGVIGNPFGVAIPCDESKKERLRQISEIISFEKESGLPPKNFHLHTSLFDEVNGILKCNLGKGSSIGEKLIREEKRAVINPLQGLFLAFEVGC